jgi:hypothetical protein
MASRLSGAASRPGSRAPQKVERPRGEESPGSTETRCRITSGGGDPRESATESKPPRSGEVRVKGWGKSPPRRWRQGRHGKPHREQDRIGMTRPPARAASPFPGRSSGWVARGGTQVPSQMNGCRVRRPNGRRAIQNPAYRPTGNHLQNNARERSGFGDKRRRSNGLPALRNRSLSMFSHHRECRNPCCCVATSRSVPIDAQNVPCYPKCTVLKGASLPDHCSYSVRMRWGG